MVEFEPDLVFVATYRIEILNPFYIVDLISQIRLVRR